MNAPSAFAGFDLDWRLPQRTPAVLGRLLSNTRILSREVAQWQKRAERHRHRSAPLLDGLLHELEECAVALRESGGVPCPARGSGRIARRREGPYCDCAKRIDALVILFADHIRVSEDAIAVLERLGDMESSHLVNKTLAAAEKGRWFLEACRNSLGGGRPPSWQDGGYIEEGESAGFFRET
jgi:hypothetical protein